MVFRRQLKHVFRFPALICLLATVTMRTAAAADCNFSEGPCTKIAGNRTVILDIGPKPPKAMQELTFTLNINPCASLPETLVIDLGMPGMVMGRNQVVMKKTNACTWKGTGIIVRCMSGRTLWQATILSGELNNTAFTFDVR